MQQMLEAVTWTGPTNLQRGPDKKCKSIPILPRNLFMVHVQLGGQRRPKRSVYDVNTGKTKDSSAQGRWRSAYLSMTSLLAVQRQLHLSLS
mmetsp:Transcript_71278/g.129981  ORF Transcript_71278/g.129981 Transcript_71278/m.129981 type:complete len:91 (+) Transcript_71278:1218-1490(+)